MTRHIVIGDIHGCYAELVDLLALVGPTSDDIIISVGDLVDRGPDPARVVDFFRTTPNTVVLTGNHERKHVRGVFSYAQEITRVQLGARYADDVAWMATLPYSLELPEAIIVHAALMPGVPLAEQKEELLCGSTSGEQDLEHALGARWWHEVYAGPKPVVFGHHVVDEPLVRPGLVYGIDTGACHGKRLTALVLPDFTLHSVPAREDHWARIKRTYQADVLAAKPWVEMPWPELDEQLARFSRAGDARAHAYVAALRDWRDALERRLVEIHEAAMREADRMTAADDRTRLAKVHGAAALLFQHFRGRLDLEAVRKNAQTPHKLAQLAAALGLSPLPVPAPSPRD